MFLSLLSQIYLFYAYSTAIHLLASILSLFAVCWVFVSCVQVCVVFTLLEMDDLWLCRCVLCLPCLRWTSYGCVQVCVVYTLLEMDELRLCAGVLCIPCWRWTSYGCVQVCVVFTLLETDDLRLQSRPVDSCVSGLRSGTCGGTRLTHTPV